MNNVIKVNFKKESRLRRNRLEKLQKRNYFIKQLLLSIFVGIMILLQLLIVVAAFIAWCTK